MALDPTRLLTGSLIAALLCSSSCSSPGAPTETAEPGAQAVDPSTGEDLDPSPEADTPTGMQGQGQQGQGTLDQQRRRALVEKYLEVARELRAQGNLDAALTELLKAKDLQPGNEEVVDLIAAIRAEQGEPAGTAVSFGEELQRLQQINEQRRRADVQNRLESASQAMNEANYASAIQDLRNALLTIELAPQQDWDGLAERARSMLREAEAQQQAQDLERQAAINEQLAARLRDEFRQEQARRQAQVESLLTQATTAFQNRQFQFAQDLAIRALELEPNNAVAFDLHNAAIKAARSSTSESYYHDKAREIRNMIEAMEDLRIPQTSILTLDVETWERAQNRVDDRIPDTVVDPANQAVWEKVRTEQVGRLTFTEESGDYRQVANNLQLITGVPIIITPEARDIIDTEGLTMVIELVNSISLSNFLDQMVGRSESLAWTVRNGVVQISTKAEAGGTNIVVPYDVRDLVFQRTSFLPPRIRDIPGDEGFAETPRTGGESEDKIAFVELDQLMTNIREATDPLYWDGEGVEMTPEDQGYLVIKASPEMHRRVRNVLNDMRRFATSVVTIDSKFLNVTRNFLQEVGVDFRGLGGSGNKGTVAGLDDITSGLDDNASRGLDNSGTGDPAANPIAGAFFNDGGDGDVRARTENFFLSDLGRMLTADGGLTASISYLDDLQLQAILRAVEKQEDAEVVNSQILTVLNNERGHVAVINQTAYVRDFDVEVAQASFIADPKVDVIQDGVVLDVRPVIHQDRKYITLSLQPTVAELQRPIPTFTTSLAGSTLPVTLQLPNLTVTTFATTAKVPDGGSVLLGGLRQVLSKERRAEVPLLGDLPLISFFFKNEGVVDENSSLMVMVQAWITDIRELAAGK